MSSSNFGNIQYKASNGQINLDEAQGIVECFVAGIGNKDSVGDICATGAFAKSLQRRKPRVVWGHNWNDPIGKVLEIYEVPVNDPRLPMKMKMAGIGGLYAKVQFNLQSEKGREAFANVAFFGEEQEWSIGYKTLRSQFDQNLQANVLYEVELYEVSPVLHGANQLTGTISVKSEEEKMHGMMPLVIGGPSAGKPSGEGLFDEGIAQRISGPQLAGVVAELSRRAGGPVMVVEATENSVIFVKPGKGKFRIGYHFTGSEYMFGKPELLEADQPKPTMPSGPAPMPGISAKPTGDNKPQVVNPAMPMPVAMKPENGGMVIVPLPPVKYEGGEGKEKPELVAEERELAESLVRIAGKYGKFDEDGDGIWAGYYPPAENKVKDIGVKCANCVLYQGNGKCKILALDVEPEGKCRFAIIPDGVVVGFGKKEYNDMLDEDEVKMVEDVEAKYPGEFILGAFRNVVKKRRKKRKEYKTLEEWGIEEQELAEKGLDPFLAHNASYVIPVNPEDAFTVKSILDPVFEYHRIDTHVNEFGIVINSPLDQESKDAIQVASISAYGILKKKLETEGIEEKALGRRLGRAIASRGIDRPNLGGKRGRRSRGSGINPPPGWDPRTVEDANLNSMVGDGTPWEQPDPTPFGPGSVNSPKPSKRQMRQRAELADTEKLSSGKRNERRHADRSADMEAKFPNPDEMAKRKLQEDIAEQWISQGLGWEEVPRYNADKGKSSDYLRGRELGVNQSRLMWNGDDTRKRPAAFDEKKKSSTDYADWYMDYANAVSSYIDANAKEGSDNWAGIEEALKTQVYEKRPNTSSWTREDVDAMNQTLDNLGLNPQRGVRSSLKDREPAPLASDRKKRGQTKRDERQNLVDEVVYLEDQRRAYRGNPKDENYAELVNRTDEAIARLEAFDKRKERDNLVAEVTYLEDQRRAYRGKPKDEKYRELVDRTDAAIAKLEAFDKKNKKPTSKDRGFSSGRSDMPSDEEIYNRRMAGETLQQVADDLGVERIDIRKAEQRHMAKLREGGKPLSSGDKRTEAERLAAWKPVQQDLRSLRKRVKGNEINDGLIGVGDMDVKPGNDFFRGRQRAYMGLMDELDEIIANAKEEGNLDLVGPTDKSRARFEKLVNAGDWEQARAHMEGEIASVREKAPDSIDGGKLSSGRKINSYEDLVDESQKLNDMDRDSDEFKTRASELLKEATRLQRAVNPDSDDFDDIQEIKDDINSLKRGGIRGFASGRTIRGYRGGEPINLPTEMLDWDDLTGAEKRQYLNEFDDIEDDEERLRTAEEEWDSRSLGMRQQMTEDMLKEIDELEAEAKKFEDTERRLSDFEGRHFAYIEEIIKNPMMADIFDYADARERLDSIRKRISDARDGETGGLSSGKTARRDLVSGNKVPGEGKFARLIDRQMGNRNDEREPSYVARKYADALVENWRSLSDSERKEFLQDEMGSEYMPKAEEFLEILDEAWATYSQRNKKFKDIDNELQDIMDSSRLSSGRKNKFSRDLADFEVERVADELDNMSEADRKEYEDYAAEYLTGKGMSPDDPDWDSELQGRIEESVADNINEQLDMADRAGRLGEPSPTTRADTRGFPQSTGFQSGRIDDWEVDFLKERLSKLKAGSEDTDILYRINQRGGIEEGRAGEAFELLKQLQSELNDLSARAFDDSQPKRRSLFNFNIYDVTEDEDVTDILFGYDTAIDDIKSAIEEHSKRLETIDNEIALIDEQLDTTTGESTRFSQESIDSELANIEQLYEDDDEEYIQKRKLGYISELAQELIDLDQGYQDATDLDSQLNQNNRLRDVSYGKYDDIDAAIKELLDNHKTYVENLTDSKSWNENQKRNLEDSGVPSIDELDAATKFIQRPDAPLEIDAEGIAADAGRDTERGFSSGRVGDKLGGWQKTDDGFEADAPGIDGLYSIGKGEDGKFYVTRTYDAVREGGQYQMDTEHDFGFSDVNSAKRWAESDYGKATMAWNYDQVYDDQMGSEIGFSSGRVRTAASIYDINPAVNPEMQGMLANRDLVDDAGISLASGRTRGQRAASRLPKVDATDKEIFERRMEGASLEDVANELGVPRQVVRQAEVRHMARMRGTLDSPIDSSYVQDYKDAESFARDMEEFAALEAAQERADELFHDRIQAGESPSAIAKEYGLRPGQVIEGAERYKQMLRERDIAAEKWLAENPEFASGRKGRSFKNPMEGMFAGERLSSGKQDEVYRAVQDRLIKMLEGADPNSWEFPWHKSGFVPTNPSNKNRPYTNINALMLMFAQQDMGYKTPMWAGFEQWKKLGGSVRKGEKGTQIFIPTIVPPKKDKDGNVVKEGFVFFKVGYVFNADQIDGIDIDALKGEQLDPAERLQELEDALAEVGAIVKTGTDGRAYYRPSTDEISMPPFESFKSREGYYATLAHEMMHWTGHTSRLNRPNMNQFGNEAYAREELVAEIASAFFLAALGVSAEPREDHAKYLANWLQALKNDPNALQEAFKEAQKAADFVIGKSPKMQKKLGKAAAEKGALPGNKDLVPSMPEVSKAFSSGKLAPDGRPYGDRYIRTADGSRSNLALELGLPNEGILSEFVGFHYPYGYGEGRPAEPGYQFFRRDSEYLGMFGQWAAVKDNDGKWQLTSWVFDNYPSGDDEGDTDGIDRDYGGIAQTFNTPEEMAAFIESYEDERQAFKKQYDKLADDLYSAQAGLNRNDADEARILESIQKLINQEMERRKYEEDEAKRLRLERDERQQQEEMMWTWKEIESQFDAETAHWSAEDWREHADDLRADIDNENARGGFSSGRVSRYNDADPATIPSIKGAAGRDDEIGSNTRAIIKNTYVPTDLYDLNDVRANGTPIRFKYKGKDRTIYPTGIKAKKEGGIYFIGVDADSGQYRSFNLEKIDGLIDGATLPINPRQPGVAKGDGKQVYVERFSSGRNEAKAAVSRMLNDIDPRVWENDDWEYEEELDRMAKSFAESYYVEDNDTVDDVFYELQLLQDALAQDGTAESDRKADFLLRVLDNFETNDYENRRERSDGQPSDSDIFEEQEDWGLYSGRKKRPASSKRRPMSDEEMQAYRDGLRLRAKTIPKKRRSGPDASEFSSDGFSSGRTESGRMVGLLLDERNTKAIENMAKSQKSPIRIGNVRDNDTRGPLDAWQVPVEPLLNVLGKQGAQTLLDVTPEDLAELLKLAPEDIKKLVDRDGRLIPGASMPEEIAFELVKMISRPYSGGGIQEANSAFEKELEKYNIDGFMQGIFGWNAKPYWYDELENPIESEREFKELVSDGAYVFGLLSPIDMDIPSAPSKPEVAGGPMAPSRAAIDKRGLADRATKKEFGLQNFAEFLGVEPGNRKGLIEKIKELTDGKVNVTSTTVGSWGTDGVPLAWAEVLIDLGIIENAEQIWGEAGRKFDRSIGKIEFHKRLDSVLKELGVKITDSKIKAILGQKAVNFRREVDTDLPSLSITAKISRGEPPMYSEFEIGRALDTLNDQLNTNMTIDDIRGAEFSSGRRAQRRVERAGRESAESLSSGSNNNPPIKYNVRWDGRTTIKIGNEKQRIFKTEQEAVRYLRGRGMGGIFAPENPPGLSSGRKNNGAPDNITPRMQNELMDWARKNAWSGFAQSLLKQFERDGFLTERQWQKLLTFVDTQKMKR